MNAGAIAGGTVAGLALLSAIIAVFLVKRRRRARNGSNITPYSPNTSLLAAPAVTSTPQMYLGSSVPYVIVDPARPSGSAASDPRSSGYSLGSMHPGYGYSQKMPLTMDQVQMNVVPLSSMSAIPPTSSIVPLAPSALCPPETMQPTELQSPLPSYSEAALGLSQQQQARPPKKRVRS